MIVRPSIMMKEHVQATINSQFVDTEDYPGTAVDTQDDVLETVWRKKKKEISENHTDTINNYLEKYYETSMVLNVDDYHNIYTNRVPK
ncbi:11002_t:CDS:2, partial [Gigaspora rosea]